MSGNWRKEGDRNPTFSERLLPQCGIGNLAGVSLRVSNRLLKAQHAFLAHLDRAASGPIQINDKVDDKSDEHHENECRERYPMSGNSRCEAESGRRYHDRGKH